MPNQPKAGTTVRRYRCEDELWEAAQATAARVGTDLSTVAREALVAFISRHEPTPEPAPLALTEGPIRLFPEEHVDRRHVVWGPCPGCAGWTLEALYPGHGRLVVDAAWEHLMECPQLVALARENDII